MLSILSRYLIKNYITYFLIVLMATVSILYLSDFIELTRIAASKNISLKNLIILSAQKTPMHIQKVLGFIILIASMITYMRMQKSNELVIFKASGLSSYQCIIPIVATGIILGLLHVTIFNPLTAILTNKFLKNEAAYLKGNTNMLSISKTGLWIKQNTKTNQQIIHALKVEANKKILHDVTFYYFDEHKGFIKRIDADSAKFENGFWSLTHAKLTHEGQLSEPVNTLNIATDLTFKKIRKSLAATESLSIFNLPEFIEIAENSGLAVNKYKLYFYRLLISPIFFASMIILGGSFSLIQSRTNKNFFVILVLALGFLIYLLSDLSFAFGVAGHIPMIFATLIPSLIASIIGIAALLHFEETKI